MNQARAAAPDTSRADKQGVTPLRTVSVVIPCHNAGDWLHHSVASCLRAGVTAGSVILVDDGSSDDAVQTQLELRPELRSVRHEQPRGVAAARAAGVRLVSTPWVIFLDQDDYLMADGVRALLEAVGETGATATVGDFVVDASPDVRRNRLWLPRRQIWRTPLLDLMFENVQIARWLLPADVVRRWSFRTDIGVADDLAIVAAVASEGKVVAIPEVVLGYRVHRQQASLSSAYALTDEQLRLLEWHLMDRAGSRHPAWRVRRRTAAARALRASRAASPRRSLLLVLRALVMDPTSVVSPFARRVLGFTLLADLDRLLRLPNRADG